MHWMHNTIYFKSPYTKDYILYDSFYMTYPGIHTERWLRAKAREEGWEVNASWVWDLDDKNVLELDGSGGCITLWMY